MDQKSYFLDNGVVVRERTNELILIDFSKTKSQLERVHWKILGSIANDVYFLKDFDVHLEGQPQSLYRASFTDRSYSISELHKVSPKYLLNFPYHAEKSDHGYVVRSLLSEESFLSECPNLTEPYNRCFVYRDYVISGALQRYRYREPTVDLDKQNYYNIQNNNWHIFEGNLYSMDSYVKQLMIVDILDMRLSAITLTQLVNTSSPSYSRIRFISSKGIIHFETVLDDKKDYFEVHLASCEREAGPQLLPLERAPLPPPNMVEVPDANDAVNARDDGIKNELRAKNEELEARNKDQDRRIEELEKKYKQLLVMMGRTGNSPAQSSH